MIIQPQLRNNNTTGGRRWTSFNVSSFKTIVLMFRERQQLLCEFWIQSFLKCDVQWENIYVCSVSTLSAMDLNVLQSWAAPQFLLWTVLGSFLSAFWLLRVTTNSTNVRVICYFLAVGWNERAWISTNTTFLLQTWIYLKSQATVGTTLPVIF